MLKGNVQKNLWKFWRTRNFSLAVETLARIKPRTHHQVFLDKFSLDKFYLLVCTAGQVFLDDDVRFVKENLWRNLFIVDTSK